MTLTAIKKSNIVEMCGRICSILALFVPVSNYNFENVLTFLNIIFEETYVNLGEYFFINSELNSFLKCIVFL